MDFMASHTCDTEPAWVGRIAVTACGSCGEVEWFSRQGPIDHAEALASLFGSFDLVGELDALGAPAPKVLAYAPSAPRKRKALEALPPNVWLRASPDLWLSHDGEVLLLAPTHRLLFDNLGA